MWATLRGQRGTGGVHRALVRELRGHFSLVARSCTCEHRNQCEDQGCAGVCCNAHATVCGTGLHATRGVCAEGVLEAGGGAASAARRVEGRHGTSVPIGESRGEGCGRLTSFAACWQFRAPYQGVAPWYGRIISQQQKLPTDLRPSMGRIDSGSTKKIDRPKEMPKSSKRPATPPPPLVSRPQSARAPTSTPSKWPSPIA